MVNMRCHRAGLAVAGKEVTVGKTGYALKGPNGGLSGTDSWNGRD